MRTLLGVSLLVAFLATPFAGTHGNQEAAAIAFWTSIGGGAAIDIYVDGFYIGALRRSVSVNEQASCVNAGDGRVIASVSPGAHHYAARSNNGGSWVGSQVVSAGGCAEVKLSCSGRDCATP